MKRLYIAQRTSQVVTGGPRRWFQVMVHESPEALRAAAEHYREGGNWSDTLACCHPAPATERLVDGEWVSSNPASWAGVLRFCEGHVTTEIVAHEMTHAALAIYRMDVCTYPNLGNGCGKREEALAYITGDLVGAASTAFHDAGVWS